MMMDEMQKQKYEIILEALFQGVPIQYSEGWDIIFEDGTLYEIYFQKKSNEEVTRKSTMTLNEFLKHFNKISNAALKRIYGDIRLHKLQRKLLKENGN